MLCTSSICMSAAGFVGRLRQAFCVTLIIIISRGAELLEGTWALLDFGGAPLSSLLLEMRFDAA